MEPPPVLQLVGHPIRWQVLRELSRSDRRVNELTGLVGEPQNLVSYHLGKLRAAGLVSGRKSSADGRDTYYTADLARVGSLLAASGSALHPGLRVEPAPRPDAVPRTRVLFLCTGNSARSQIAEALAVERSAGSIDARSAGSHPKPLHPNAVRVMQERYGIDLSGRRSRHVDEVVGEPFDRVVTLCDRVREVCPELPGAAAAHWSTPDPAAGSGDDASTYPAFVELAADLETRIDFLVAEVAAAGTEPIPA